MKRIFAQRPRKPGSLRLTLTTVALCLVLAEIAGRLLAPQATLWNWPNYVAAATARDPEHEAQMGHDPELGFAPIPGYAGRLKGQPISFSNEGLRNHPIPPGATGPTVLVVGDSLTEGYMVGDEDTWPAQLQKMGMRRILNGAVRAYGIDQMVLRAERLAPPLKPNVLVLAFIPDDIERASLSIRDNVPKPYFMIDGLGLKLANVPVPRSNKRDLPLWKEIFGYSYLVDWTMRRLGLGEFWYGGYQHAHTDGDEVSCRLMTRLGALTRKLEARGIVVALYEDQPWRDAAVAAADRKRSQHLLDCATRAGLEARDSWAALHAAGADSKTDTLYVNHHFTRAGNEVVAKLVATALEGMAK